MCNVSSSNVVAMGAVYLLLRIHHRRELIAMYLNSCWVNIYIPDNNTKVFFL